MDAGVKHLDVHIYLVTLLFNKCYNPLVLCTDLSQILIRLAVKSYLTSWCINVDVDGVDKRRPKPLCPHLEITLQ